MRGILVQELFDLVIFTCSPCPPPSRLCTPLACKIVAETGGVLCMPSHQSRAPLLEHLQAPDITHSPREHTDSPHGFLRWLLLFASCCLRGDRMKNFGGGGFSH